MAEEEEIDVQVDGEPEPEPTVQIAGEEKTETPKEEPADLSAQFKELQAQAERDQKARLDAERRANEAVAAQERITQQAHEAISSRDAQSIDTRIAAAETEAKAGEAAYKAALEAGDFAGAATAQRQMARAEARLENEQAKKAELENRRQPIEAPQHTDPVEAFIAGRTPPTQEWLRNHRDWVADPRKSAKLTAAHWSAMGDGIQVDTPAYFDAVETFLGMKEKEEKPRSSNGQFRAKTPPAAPVAVGGGISGNTIVRLSKSEATSATDGTILWNYDDPSPQKRFKKGDPIGVQEFARRKQKMIKDGLYDKSYME